MFRRWFNHLGKGCGMRLPYISRRLGVGIVLAGALLLVLGGVLAQTTASAQGGCSIPWYFTTRTPGECPASRMTYSPAALLEFERGVMFWVQSTDTIYVLYRDWQAPYWESYPDTWTISSAERDPAIVGPLGLWQQPRRGFGQVWRHDPDVRSRLGWALNEWETDFIASIQQGGGGSVFLTDDENKVYALPGDGSGWDVFSWQG